MQNTIDLSVIIVNYNTKELLESCLISLTKSLVSLQNLLQAEIILVDNGSSDQSTLMVESKFKLVKLIKLGKNSGFAAGNNVGIKKSKGRYVLLLNSDTEVNSQAISGMLKFMDTTANAGAATCRLVMSNGLIDPACHRGFPTPWASLTYFLGLEKLFPRSPLFAQYHQSYKDYTKTHEIDTPAGAFFIFRKEIIRQIGLLDEQFFMYGEDIDFSYRLKKAHWKIFYVPDYKILHRKKQSGRANSDEIIRLKTEKHFYEAMKLFYKKHFSHRYNWLVNQVVLLGIYLKSSL